MTNVQFYFDPSCPWCWVTSRWLVQVQQDREINIDWLPFSLAMKNDELGGNNTTGHMVTHTISHKVLRIIEVINSKEGINRGTLYTEFGKSYFIDPELNDDEFIEKVLDRLDLDKSYLKEADKTETDKILQKHLDDAISVVGDDVGVPLIIFANDQGEKQGYFGPVITALPDKQEGLDLWDGLVKLASNTSFFELKRTRTIGTDIQSTKKLFPELDT